MLTYLYHAVLLGLTIVVTALALLSVLVAACTTCYFTTRHRELLRGPQGPDAREFRAAWKKMAGIQ